MSPRTLGDWTQRALPLQLHYFAYMQPPFLLPILSFAITTSIFDPPAPEPNPSTDLYMTLASSPSRDPGIVSSSGPETGKSGTKTRFGHAPSNSTPLPNHRFLDKMVHNISAKLSPFNGTLLERLESYIRATNFPLHGNRTIQGVAKAIYTYLIRWKPLVFQEMVYNRLVEETDGSPPKRDLEDRNAAFSEAYTPPEHAKPAVVATSHNGIEVSLDGVRGVSENVVIRYHIVGSDQGGELVVPGGTSTAVIPGLDPGTSYQVEIHGVVKGHSSKSYSFVTTTGTRVGRTSARAVSFPLLSCNNSITCFICLH